MWGRHSCMRTRLDTLEPGWNLTMVQILERPKSNKHLKDESSFHDQVLETEQGAGSVLSGQVLK